MCIYINAYLCVYTYIRVLTALAASTDMYLYIANPINIQH